MKDRIGLAVIGTGMAAKPHALALRDLADRIDVRGVYSRSAAARQSFCELNGFKEADDLEALARDPSVDALLLITPPNARIEPVKLFAKHGKHILLEKPLERTLDAAEQIVDICEEANVSLGVVFQHRFREASETLAEILVQGELGSIEIVRAEIPWWRDQSYYDEPGRGTYSRDGGGVLISQAIHTLDLMLSLTGPVASVQASCGTTSFHKMEAEDFSAGALKFESGAIGSFFASTASFPGQAESLTFNCENGSALLQSGTLTINWRDGRVETIGEEAGTGGGADPMAFPYDWHKSLIADFADAIKTGRPPRITGSQALYVHSLIAAIESSSRTGRAVNITKRQTS